MCRSWLTSSIASPRRAFSRASNSRICAWIVTSSAVVGSSAISSAGSHASAIAIITRCRCPPDSWCGNACNRPAASANPASASAAITRACSAAPRNGVCSAIASATCRPTRVNGFRLVIGS